MWNLWCHYVTSGKLSSTIWRNITFVFGPVVHKRPTSLCIIMNYFSVTSNVGSLADGCLKSYQHQETVSYPPPQISLIKSWSLGFIIKADFLLFVNWWPRSTLLGFIWYCVSHTPAAPYINNSHGYKHVFQIMIMLLHVMYASWYVLA